VSKERARRRAERVAVAEKDKARRARRVARRARGRAFVQALTPRRRRRTGRLFLRRSRLHRIGIVALPLVAVAAICYLVADPALRFILIALLVLVLPAVVVVVFGRRS
jgi:Flp pilus assembly protein TadB